MTQTRFRIDDSKTPFWQRNPVYHRVNARTFLDSNWQIANSISSQGELIDKLRILASASFVEDVKRALPLRPMATRLTPYILSLVDWSDPWTDPVRRQFIPVKSELLEDHPLAHLDSLAEAADSPVSMVVHRYRNRVLLLSTLTCPVYCRFCTRSYIVGPSTEHLPKHHIRLDRSAWRRAIDYVTEHEEIDDVVLSGGDVFNLSARQLAQLANELIGIPHIRRLRLATRGLAAVPMKLITDSSWTQALVDLGLSSFARDKELALHVHLNSTNEITWITREAISALRGQPITIRNQTVLQRGVNDTDAELRHLINAISRLHIEPYYVYQHDLVPHCEDLRTPLSTSLQLEKHLRGSVGGVDMPAFVIDLPGGGGKRSVYSFEHYDRESGVSVFTSPEIKPGEVFIYADPLHSLATNAAAAWRNPARAAEFVSRCLTEAQDHRR